METRVIKTPNQHQLALKEIESLIRIDPAPGTTGADRLELLTLLVQAYEGGHFQIAKPDPISAICFRMDQLGLSRRDLIPFLGSRSRVSEVLSGRRPLTLAMIRALHKALDIPADILLQERGATLPDDQDLRWDRFPLREMARRGWLGKNQPHDMKERAEELIREFLSPLGNRDMVSALYRHGLAERSSRKMDSYALVAWTARVLIRAKQVRRAASGESVHLAPEFLQEIARLSWSSVGPRLAQELLAKNGITMLVEPHLPGTHLDGAAMLDEDGNPVVALTLRHDRIDSFWFTLMHELAHIALHVRESGGVFIDDLDEGSKDVKENQADQMASEALIPSRIWKKSRARIDRTPGSIRAFAETIRVHPAIIAGRIRFEARNYRFLSQMVGYHKVRVLFQ